VSVARETIERLEREVELTKTTTFEDTRVTALTLQLEQAEQRARHLEETLHRNETKRDLETQALEHRVRAAIGAKDETIAKLSVQLQDLRGLME
jgi:predicted RNase H-like nuclease (RuvC/YqgF family)